MILKPLDKVEPDSSGPPLRTCENCGQSVPSDKAINVIVCIGSPGHPDLPPFQCPQIEHWACSPNCWGIVAHACVDEHIQPTLTYRLTQMKGA